MSSDDAIGVDLVRDRLDYLQLFAGVGYWELEPRTDPPSHVAFSEELYRIHGVAPGEEFDLARGLELTHPEDRPRIAEAVRRAIDAGEPYDLEARLVTPDGELRWFHTVCEPVEEDGEVVLRGGEPQARSVRHLEASRRRHTASSTRSALRIRRPTRRLPAGPARRLGR